MYSMRATYGVRERSLTYRPAHDPWTAVRERFFNLGKPQFPDCDRAQHMWCVNSALHDRRLTSRRSRSGMLSIHWV